MGRRSLQRIRSGLEGIFTFQAQSISWDTALLDESWLVRAVEVGAEWYGNMLILVSSGGDEGYKGKSLSLGSHIKGK